MRSEARGARVLLITALANHGSASAPRLNTALSNTDIAESIALAIETLTTRLDSASHWGEIPGHSVEDWRSEVEGDDTRLGYLDWVESRIMQGMEDMEQDRESSS